MFACVKYEAIGWCAPCHCGSLLAQMLATKFMRNQRKPWCARVVGFFPSGKPKYEFLRGKVDYRNSNSVMSRGVELIFYPQSGSIYHAHYFSSWRSSCDDWFWVSDAGDIIQLAEADALAKAKGLLNVG